MKIIKITQRPDNCPKCGGEVCDILYELPTATAREEYYAKYKKHLILGGCCIYDDMPTYQCYDCGQQFIQS